MPGRHFAIISLPRSGSTSLASLLDCHRDARCLIEPFHPKRYRGVYRSGISCAASLTSTISQIFSAWTGFKHVWESTGWPFQEQPSLNDHIALYPGISVIIIVRKNWLRRFVSNFICRHTQYWIGNRREFHNRLNRVHFKPLDPEAVARQIASDRAAVQRQLTFLETHQVRRNVLVYEELFHDDHVTEGALGRINGLLSFLGLENWTMEEFIPQWTMWLSPDANRWASPGVYRRIPGIDGVEYDVGSDENGWLFK